MRKTLIAVALAIAFAPAAAQGPGSGPGMGPGMMGGGYGMMGLAALDLSDAQAEKIFGI